ncbi:nardilysin-like [Leptopilina heterotoma]|uniref:nardilysin-like n=1 Tax=Leptopilina heterotoma TaxID=63436 RepID=UPI001CA879EC|nr:nardilysin-like [Leptopilina heterotoma]
MRLSLVCISKVLSLSRYDKKVSNLLIMPKRHLQNTPVVKKLKSNHNFQVNERNNKMVNTLEINSSNGNCTRDVKVEYLNTPVKSENDKKLYRVIRLENGLTALLIADTHSSEELKNGISEIGAEKLSSESDDSEESENEDDNEVSDENDESDEDESDDDVSDDNECDDDIEFSNSAKRSTKEEKKAACALCVGVGSFSDPAEIPGLAHFLEHMVFMGSKKYPEENDFDSFIKKRGGSDNASTECEQTTFHFEIQEKHLPQALDRFAQFFISPLMRRDAITREREVVESEFQMALPSDLYRKEQLFCSFAKPNHPATKFAWGNLTTLRDSIEDDKLYEELHKFRERHYSAHRMTLAVQARLSLDALEQLVKDCFSDVPSNGLPSDDFSKFKGADSFDTSDFRNMYKMKPVKDICQIELTWSMPPLHHLYKSKPHQYVSWIIGHEGKGSLINYLRKKMWCLDIFTGNAEGGFEHSSMYALFSLCLTLTDEGHKHLKEVLEAVFSYINMVRKNGPDQRIYNEISLIEKTNFKFMDEEDPVEYVESLCENMHFYAPEDYINGNDLYFEYNPSGIQDCLNTLRADNVNIIIFDKKFNEEELINTEPWFNTKYSRNSIPNEWTETWKIIEPLPEFHLPEPNIYITTDFKLMTLPENVPKYPTKIHSDEIMEVWYRPDPKFRLPEALMYFYLISPSSIATPEGCVMMDLFIATLKQLLVEKTYAATAAELHHSIYTCDKGVVLKVDGYNQKLPLLLNTIIECMAESPNLISKDLFDIMKQEQLKSYYNKFLKPSKLVKDIRMCILILRHCSSTDKYAAISSIDYDQFLNFIKHFTDHLFIQCLVQGNVTMEDVIENVTNCRKILKCGSLLPNTMPQFRVTQIPIGIQCCRVKNFNNSDANSVVTNYYQSDTSSIKVTVIIELLMMIMEEPLFNQLRTLEQLGYNINCLIRDTFGILGYSITVYTQATKFTTEYIDERIEEFMKLFNDLLSKMSDDEFNNVKEALIKLKQTVDIDLTEEIVKNWAEITTGEYLFDRVDREVETLETITMDELKKWIEAHTKNGSNFRKLSIQIQGSSEKKITNTINGEHESPTNVTTTTTTHNQEIPCERGKMKFPLQYVTSSNENADECCILDIEEFQKELQVFPIKKTAL